MLIAIKKQRPVQIKNQTKLLVAACSVATLIPFMMSQSALAEINLFQKKEAQTEAPRLEETPQASTAQTEESIATAPSNTPNQVNASVSTNPQLMSTKSLPRIIIVDVQGVLMSSVVGKDIKKQFDDKQAAFMKEIEVEEGELKKTEQDLLRQRTVLSQDVFAKKKAEFDERMVALNTKFQKNRQILEEAFNLARTDVESKLLDVIKEVKIEQSANLVLPAQQVIMGDDQMDVTNEVLARFNKKVPGYKVNF